MDMITLAMAKAYSDSNGGYVERRIDQVFLNRGVYGDFTANSLAANYEYFKPDTAIYNLFTSLKEADPDVNVTVVWDDTVYKCPILKVGRRYGVGNEYIRNPDSLDSGEPFLLVAYSDGQCWCTHDTASRHGMSAYTETEIIHPIDPRCIPAMDSITLNGADGKQYKVAVDANGALTATAI